MRLTCAQTGRCQFCGQKIYRMAPTQAWMTEFTAETDCFRRNNTGTTHKPEPWETKK